jgi:aspartate/methionine/tyrosine aminotransferase
VPILADEVYSDLGFDGPTTLLGSLDPDAPIISFSSLSKAYLAPGWRAGWLGVGRSERLDDVLAAIKKLADGQLYSQRCSAPSKPRDRRPIASRSSWERFAARRRRCRASAQYRACNTSR